MTKRIGDGRYRRLASFGLDKTVEGGEEIYSTFSSGDKDVKHRGNGRCLSPLRLDTIGQDWT